MIEQIVEAYRTAHSRLLLLDYDGVLAPIVTRPEMAAPTEDALRLLGELSTQPRTKIVVVSGRDQATLDDWLGDLDIDMSAEHGHFAKVDGAWRETVDLDLSWRDDVSASMTGLVEEYPGSHIETKPASLVWHYRQVVTEIDEEVAKQKIEQAAGNRADVMLGKCVIDVRAPGVDKGVAARQWYDDKEWDFVLCIGDDITDEAMFTALPASAWTIKVGVGETSARLRLRGQSNVIDILRQLAA